MTPLPDIETTAVAAYWQRCVERSRVPADAMYADADCFGDSVELADELLGLILHGPKRATAAVLADHEHSGDPVPVVGDYFVATDGSGQPRAVIRTTEVRVGPLSSVDEQFAWDEGEGDRSREYWLDAHHRCFRRAYERLGLDFHDDIEVVFERFDLICGDPA